MAGAPVVPSHKLLAESLSPRRRIVSRTCPDCATVLSPDSAAARACWRPATAR